MACTCASVNPTKAFGATAAMNFTDKLGIMSAENNPNDLNAVACVGVNAAACASVKPAS